uniref:Retrovirus-related Pol polyprotein n=1 Tax=Tanacetum cinerariifolium TaxID=118510 RepID=A0A699IND9_TANCI|nr:retrovirus-related Pol polyprotein [Tanacetum cinerariifolium]
MEDEFKPSVQPQRRVNPNIKEVVKKEVIELLDAGLIYPISDSPWVSPVHVVPKKGGMNVVKNEKNELIPKRMKTTFTYPYGTFAYKRMPFGLCNAPATFQHYMTAIFHEMVEDNMEVFMDDFFIFGKSFDHCLKNQEKLLKICRETNLVLNWVKCHIMVKKGIVLSHKVSGSRIEIRDKKGAENLTADHLSRLENPDLGKLTKAEIRDLFPKERLVAVFDNNNEPWCVTRDEAAQILGQCHSGPSRGYHGIATKARKVFKARFYWPHIFYDARRIFPGKLKSRWFGPFSVSKDLKNGAIELYDEGGNEFIVNKQRVKPYQKDVLEADKHDDITLDDEGEVT